MKILHLGDLHIGKKLNDFCLLDDQKFVLTQAIDLIKREKIDAVFICGDIFDKPVAPIGALEVFNWFLDSIVKLNIKIFIISGNHDNIDRISYLSDLLKKNNIYVAKNFSGKIEKVSLDDDVDIYLLPYLYPAIIRKYYPNNEIKTYNDAIKIIVDDINLDKNKLNFILAHQFVTSKNNSSITSNSETKSVGEIDNISYEIFKNFDYCALGHLHCPQNVGDDKTYYCGSILKYSFSEINQKKSFRIIEIDKNKNISFSNHKIDFLHDMKEYKGYIDEFLDEKFYSKINTDDFIHFTLLDEYVINAKKKLSLIYKNILYLDFENTFTKSLQKNLNPNITNNKTIYEHFCDFYLMMQNENPDDKKQKIIKDVLNSVSKEAI